MLQVCDVLERVIPTAAGLAAIPCIVHPIDNAVHAALDHTLRPYMKTVICDRGGGRTAGLDMCAVTSASESSREESTSAGLDHQSV